MHLDILHRNATIIFKIEIKMWCELVFFFKLEPIMYLKLLGDTTWGDNYNVLNFFFSRFSE